jgi:hypothetical protein
VDVTPSRVAGGLTEERARDVASKLQAAGAEIKVEPCP